MAKKKKLTASEKQFNERRQAELDKLWFGPEAQREFAERVHRDARARAQVKAMMTQAEASAKLAQALERRQLPPAETQEPLLPIDRARAVVRDIYASKPPPPKLKMATRDVAEECERRGWPPPSSDTVSRVLEDLGHRPRRHRR